MTLSVAMCTYNGAKYLREQLESILNQELRVDEIVICDDCSTDSTIIIIQEIAKQYPYIKWQIVENKENLGVTKNFEKAIKLCSGDYIFLADQDDLWRKDKTSIIIQYFKRNPRIQVVFTDADLIGPDGESLTERSLLDSVYLLPNMKYWKGGLQFEILVNSNRATGATMAFSKQFICKFVPLIEQKYCLHDEQIAMTAHLNNCLGIITERLIKYRQHGKNVLGVPKDNWVYTGENCPDLLLMVLETCSVKDYCWKHKNIRMVFYSKRNYKRQSFIGKIYLCALLPLYVFFYKRYFLRIFHYDMCK